MIFLFLLYNSPLYYEEAREAFEQKGPDGLVAKLIWEDQGN